MGGGGRRSAIWDAIGLKGIRGMIEGLGVWIGSKDEIRSNGLGLGMELGIGISSDMGIGIGIE